MPLETKKFDFELPENGGVSVALLGSTRSGKTTFLKYLLDKHFPKHLKVLMSNSIHAPIYKDMKDMVKSPLYIPKLVKEGYMINKETKNHYDFLYILDDIVTGKFDKELLKLLAIYRNSNMSAIISIQSPILLNSATRGNLNYVLLGRMNSEEQIEKTIKMYLTSYLEGKNMTDKIKNYKALTEDHFWIVINNLDGSVYRTKLKL
jgi:dephospho-CoA kinase